MLEIGGNDMKQLLKLTLALLLVSTVSGCAFFNGLKDDVKNEMDKIENEGTADKKEEKLSDLMTYLKDNGIKYENDETLNNFDFAAKEGMSFTVDGEKVYVYRVDTQNEMMNSLMQQAAQSNTVSASRDGVEKKYGASVNGTYLLIYDLESKVNNLLDGFQKYQYKDSTETNNNAA